MLLFWDIGKEIAKFFWRIVVDIVAGVFSLYKIGYELFSGLVTHQVLGESDIANYVSKAYVLISIIMLFVLAYNVLTMVVDPDKNKGGAFAEKVIKNLVKSLATIAIIPFAFTIIYDIQAGIIEIGTIEKIFVTGGSKEEESNCSSYNNGGESAAGKLGAQAAGVLFSAFFTPVNDEENKIKAQDDWTRVEKYDELDENGDAILGPDGKTKKASETFTCSKNSCSLSDAKRCIANYGQMGVFKAFVGNIADGKLEFPWLIALIAGFYACYVILSFAFDMAIRSVKLAALQIIAPVAVAISIAPSKEGVFKSWFKETKDTFLSAFFRIISLNLTMVIIGKLGAGDLPGGVFGFVIGILGFLTFMKQMPKLIEDILGIKVDAKLGIMDKIKEPLDTVRSHAAGTAGAVGGLIVGKGNPLAAIRAARENYKNKNLSGIIKEQDRRDEYKASVMAAGGGLAGRRRIAASYMRKSMGLRTSEEAEARKQKKQALKNAEQEMRELKANIKLGITKQTQEETGLNYKKVTDRFNKARNAFNDDKRNELETAKNLKTEYNSERGRLAALRSKALRPGGLDPAETLELRRLEGLEERYSKYFHIDGSSKADFLALEALETEYNNAAADYDKFVEAEENYAKLEAAHEFLSGEFGVEKRLELEKARAAKIEYESKKETYDYLKLRESNGSITQEERGALREIEKVATEYNKYYGAKSPAQAEAAKTEYNKIKSEYEALKVKEEAGTLTAPEAEKFNQLNGVVEEYNKHYESDGSVISVFSELEAMEKEYDKYKEQLSQFEVNADAESKAQLDVLRNMPKSKDEVVAQEQRIKLIEERKKSTNESISVAQQIVSDVGSAKNDAISESLKHDSKIVIGADNGGKKLEIKKKVTRTENVINKLNLSGSATDRVSQIENFIATNGSKLQQADLDKIQAAKDKISALPPGSVIPPEEIMLSTQVTVQDVSPETISVTGKPHDIVESVENYLRIHQNEITDESAQKLRDSLVQIKEAARLASMAEDKKIIQEYKELQIKYDITEEALARCIDGASIGADGMLTGGTKINFAELGAAMGLDEEKVKLDFENVEQYLKDKHGNIDSSRLKAFVQERIIKTKKDENQQIINDAKTTMATCDREIAGIEGGLREYRRRETEAVATEEYAAKKASTGYSANNDLFHGGKK